MKNNFIFNIFQGIFTLIGLGLIIGGFLCSPFFHDRCRLPAQKFSLRDGGFFIVWPLILFGTIKFFRRRALQRIENLKANGIKGKARVAGMRRTGVTINHIPQLALELEIKTDLGEHFTATYKKCIDPLYYSFIRPDLDLPVYVDQSNKKSLYVDFEDIWKKPPAGPEKK